jgi:AcrR family transcriptional regulator
MSEAHAQVEAGAPRARGTVTRSEVLTVSATLFARRGYRGTNLQLVADQLQVTRQALYYHFKSKGEILGALFDALMTKLEVAVDQAPTNEGAPDLAEMLRAHVHVILENPDLTAILMHERPEIAKLDRLDASKRRQRYTDRFVKAYKETKFPSGRGKAPDARVLVNMLLSSANAIPVWYRPGSTSQRAVLEAWDAIVTATFSH